jgi:hypothetical protein
MIGNASRVPVDAFLDVPLGVLLAVPSCLPTRPRLHCFSAAVAVLEAFAGEIRSSSVGGSPAEAALVPSVQTSSGSRAASPGAETRGNDPSRSPPTKRLRSARVSSSVSSRCIGAGGALDGQSDIFNCRSGWRASSGATPETRQMKSAALSASNAGSCAGPYIASNERRDSRAPTALLFGVTVR